MPIPYRYRGNVELAAPTEHFVELPRAETVHLQGISDALPLSVTAITIKYDADMTWQWPLAQLMEQAKFINTIKGAFEQVLGTLPPLVCSNRPLWIDLEDGENSLASGSNRLKRSMSTE